MDGVLFRNKLWQRTTLPCQSPEPPTELSPSFKMPSCVIKCCKNYSGRKNKRPDITFHLFPKNESQLNDWIKAVQESRNQNDWKPSKASVVCSTHFDPDDLFSTKNGLVRVVANAVPRLFLKEQPRIDQQYAAEPNLNRPLQLLIELEQPWIQQQPAEDPNLNRPLPEFVKIEPPYTQEQPVEEHNLSRTSLELTKLEPRPWPQEQPAPEANLNRPEIFKLEPPWPQEQPAEEPHFNQPEQMLIELDQPMTPQQPVEAPDLNIPLQEFIKREPPWTQQQPVKQHNLSRSAIEIIDLKEPSTHNDVEQPLPTIPRREYLQKIITRKDDVIKNKNKAINALNQKIRRLQYRNKSLKTILRTLKNNFFIDTDLLGKLNEDIVAINLFNIYNRKKLKKNVEYTPVFIKFCQTLNAHSPKAYDYVRDTFDTCLPHRKTLAKWYRDLNSESGLT